MKPSQKRHTVWKRLAACSTALALCACAREPADRPAPPPAARAVAASPAPAAAAPAPSGLDLDDWAARLRRAGREGKDLDGILREVDPGYDPAVRRRATVFANGAQTPAPFDGVDVFRGQMDGDPEPEAVVQVRHLERSVTENERMEAFWIGIFDGGPGGFVFVGSVQRASTHCLWERARLGVVLGFTEKEPGAKAALWIRSQVSESCGTYVSFGYEKRLYRLRDGDLVARNAPAPKGVEMDRSAPPQ